MASVDGIDTVAMSVFSCRRKLGMQYLHLLTMGRAKEVFAFADNGHFESWQRSMKVPLGSQRFFISDAIRGVLKRSKASDKDVCQHKKSLVAVVVFSEAPQDAGCNNLTQHCSRVVDILPIAHMRLFV